jgi:hypothetical protein
MGHRLHFRNELRVELYGPAGGGGARCLLWGETWRSLGWGVLCFSPRGGEALLQRRLSALQSRRAFGKLCSVPRDTNPRDSILSKLQGRSLLQGGNQEKNGPTLDIFLYGNVMF